MSFTYRKRTFKTPKAGSKKESNEDTKETGAVTPSSFSKAGNKRVVKTVPETEEDVSFNYVPLSKRRKRADEKEPEPVTENNNNNNNNNTEKTKASPKKSSSSPKKPAPSPKQTSTSPKKTSTTSKKASAKAEVPPPQTPSPAKVSSSGPVPLKTPEAMRNRKLNHLQKLHKAPLKEVLQNINKDYTGLNSFVVEHFVQIIPEYFSQLAEVPDVARLPKKPRVSSNPANDLLRKKEHVLRHMLERFSDEVKEWEELKAQYPPVKGAAPQPPKSEPHQDVSLSKEGKDAIEKSIQQLILEVDTIKPGLRDIQTFNTVADQLCSHMIKQIQQEGFKNYDIQDPKKLIKNIAFSDK